MEQTKQTKKATVNLFIDNSTLDILRNEAKERGTSLNARINTILTKYIQFYKRAEEVDETCVITKKYFQFVIDYIDENDNITEVTEAFRTWMPALLNDRNLPFTLDNFIQHILMGIGVTSRTVDNFTHYVDGSGNYCLSFTHRFGIRWSRILSSGINTVITELLKYHTKCELYPGSFVIKVLDYRS